MAEIEQPIIIKKVYKVEGGHHGGAWKVAYADFVTAMMAFFLLLWLLSSASEAKLEGIADYFSPTIGLKDALGIGFKGGMVDSLEEGTKRENTSKPSIIAGQAPQGIKIGEPKPTVMIDTPEGEQMLFDKTASSINQKLADDEILRNMGENVMMKQKPEGLSVQLMDSDKESMFKKGGVRLTATGERMLAKITQVLNDVPNHISVTGHTDASAFKRMRYYTNWELSADRANAARRFMIESGLNPIQIGKVQGRASKELISANPLDAKNRRIEIILLKGDHMHIAPTERPVDIGGYLEDDKSKILKFEKKSPLIDATNSKIKQDAFEPKTVIPKAINDEKENSELFELK